MTTLQRDLKNCGVCGNPTLSEIERVVDHGSPWEKFLVLSIPSIPKDVRDQLSPEHFYNDAVARLEKFAQKQIKENKHLGVYECCVQDPDTKLLRFYKRSKMKLFFDAYMQTAVPYCMPKLLPLDHANPSHRLADQVIRGFPFTSASYQWPTDKNGKHLHPIVQISLERAGKLLDANLGEGLLQVWLDNQSLNPIIRVIPPSALSDPMDTFYPEDASCDSPFTHDMGSFPHPRIEWLPMGRMFPCLYSTNTDWWDIELEIPDTTIEELSEKIDTLGIPRYMRNYFGCRAPLRLGGFPDSGGNAMCLISWPNYGSHGCVLPEKVLLYMHGGDTFCLVVTFEHDDAGNVEFDARISYDR